MADNVAISAGSGVTVATDEVVDVTLGTVQVQYTKLMDGTLDGTTKAVVTVAEPATTDGALVVAISPNSATATTQGADATGIVGPLVQGVVNDNPESFISGTVRPVSITPEGRLRVSSVPSTIDRIWQETWSNPWDGNNSSMKSDFPSVTDSQIPFAGET